MKKLIYIFLLIIPIYTKALSADSYIVMDMDSGRILEGKNIEEKSLIASTTKILTAIVAIENSNLEEIVEVNDEILKSYGSGIYIQVGEELTLDDLLYGLLLRSGNDAAVAIASHVSGSIESFVFLMNATAEKIGMSHSIFYNPSGLEEENGNANKSTVYDMALLTQYAMKNKEYQRIVKTKEIMVKSSYKTYSWTNKNKLLHSYKYCTGGKTGYTKKAHRTLVTTATKNDMNLIVVTFNDGNDFKDHHDLYEKYFNNYERIKVLDKNDDYGEEYKLKNDFYIVKNNKDKIETNIIKNSTEGALYGSIVGKIEVILNGEVIGSRNLYYNKKSITLKKSFINKLIDFLTFW
ncbi:MAG TPA: D-alanyl-D-alanine carboxypeptidase [Firmicutes bacterium]|nr:D-alanyl-D-alanine carboxypeptidase [Bacillota bacterium]